MTTPQETFVGFDISSVQEQYVVMSIPTALIVERVQMLMVSPSKRLERITELFIKTSDIFERSVSLQIIGYIGRESFQRLVVSGALQQLEQYKNFTISDFDRLYYEAFQRFSIYGGLIGIVTEVGISIVVDGSVIPFITGTGGDQQGAYFKIYEFTTIYDSLVRSLPDPDKSVCSAQIIWSSTVETETGPQIVFDRVVDLIFDSVLFSRGTDQDAGVTTETATLRLVSPTAALGWMDGNLGADRITRSWPVGTLAGQVLGDIVPESLGYDLQIDDFTIGQLDVDGLYPNEILPLIFIFCVIHTTDDGTLVIRNEPDILGTMIPDHDNSPQTFEMSAADSDDQGQYRPNFVRVSNYQEAQIGQSLPAPEIVPDPDDPRKATVYAYPVPWRQVWLRTSHLPHVNFTTSSGVEEIIDSGNGEGEQVGFVDGLATTQRPITGGLVGVDYGGNTDLGAVTPSEDGTLTTAVSARSLATVKYSTRRWVFEIADYDADDIQLWIVDEDDL